ncbi:hypothetical protein KR222_011056, partial [Zaprionus bogoriensis]
MALVAHRMMLPARHRRTQQQVARNKVGVLLVPSLADYYNREADAQQQQQLQLQLQQQVMPATSQLELQAAAGSEAKVSCNKLQCNLRETRCTLHGIVCASWANTLPRACQSMSSPVRSTLPPLSTLSTLIPCRVLLCFHWRQLYASHWAQTSLGC